MYHMSVIPILYEDEQILVINKPAGLVVHSDGRTEELTLVDWFVGQYPDSHGVGEPIQMKDGTKIDRSGIVHRLDRDTSGVIILAKTPEAHAHLKEQFQNRTIEKTYVAFVYDHVKDDEGTIDRPIGRSKNDFRKWTAQRGTRGEMREAVTHYRVLERFETEEWKFTCLELNPKTGRTHQLRVHLKAINHPILCDALYAPNRPCLLGFERMALHAKKLVFTNTEGKQIEVAAQLPHDFKKTAHSDSAV